MLAVGMCRPGQAHNSGRFRAPRKPLGHQCGIAASGRTVRSQTRAGERTKANENANVGALYLHPIPYNYLILLMYPSSPSSARQKIYVVEIYAFLEHHQQIQSSNYVSIFEPNSALIPTN